MSTAPLIPDSAPFTEEQRAWLNGFLAGLFSRSTAGAAQPTAAPALKPLTILWGSQTGTSESLAKKLAKQAGKHGFAPTIVDMAQATVENLAAHSNLLVITSTYGDGEPPDNAKELHSALKSATGPKLANVSYSVCALGDTNYTQFCQCGKDFDAWLEKLGAKRVAPCAECDLDYDAKFAAWTDNALRTLGESKIEDRSSRPEIETTNSELPSPISASSSFGRSKPFPAPVLTVRCLNGEGSAKEVNHVELSLEGSGLEYKPGDALGVFPRNCPGLVSEVLATLRCDGEEAVPTPDGRTAPLRLALTEFYDLGKPPTALLERIGVAVAAGQDGGTASAPLDVLDALQSAPADLLPPAEFVAMLRKLQPRLYSIASSPRKHPGQVHLTVGTVRYTAGGRARKGVCSTFLAERAAGAGSAPVFVHSSKTFSPPDDGSRPMIMVGPGTGIAPFRAFLEEREATGATGKNWLFFGDQHEATDFLYRNELEAMKGTGLLTRLDTAWSRDQEKKVYVQHRMIEAADGLFAWIEAGAHFYVCGDASRMARDVDAALHKVVETAGGKSAEEAAAYVKALKAAKRYQRDVY